MSFSLLPNELILLVITHIPPSGIEAFALINTQCHVLSVPVLNAHLKRKHAAAAMYARFPHPNYPQNSSLGSEALIKKGLLEAGMIPSLEYLHLNGDLHWLQAQTPEIAAEHVWERGRAASVEAVQKLVADVERLGLTLPTGFATFIGTQDLIERMHLGGSTISLGELFKCTPEQDGGNGGHIARFLCDQQGCGYWGLYMDTAGHSCVVCAEDWSDFGCGWVDRYTQLPVVHEAIAEADATLRFICVKAEWEEWIANMYFDGWIWGTLWAGREVVGWEMEYVRHFEKQKDTVSGGHEEVVV
ncbi:hypothetical protein C8F04DRAFT_1125041 [Mycena alexandri]|uniref:F-box domain-containing protein n=1 Tax=Mycena alexandri TaxID=1745969 RepID=A0AAD6SEP8_9AGAR|nr:hypothetical protein C8F04DRAFT_1125041 [Mycena alexandri]